LNQQVFAEFNLTYDKEKAAKIIADCIAEGKSYLGELEGLAILEAYGFQTLPTKLAATSKKAAQIAKEMGYPVVMKIVSPQIIHKSDAGGVVVGIKDDAAAMEAFDKIVANATAFDPKAEIKGVLVQKMASPGQELILGMSRYPGFGPLLMFGIGGIFVEVFQDVSFSLAPITRNDANRMVRKIKGYKLLQEFRGRPKADIDTLEKAIMRLSAMVMDHPQILELDVNPYLAHAEGKGATVADCRIILKADA
jgi:acetate---CoA ligase (ADP-forming)